MAQRPLLVGAWEEVVAQRPMLVGASQEVVAQRPLLVGAWQEVVAQRPLLVGACQEVVAPRHPPTTSTVQPTCPLRPARGRSLVAPPEGHQTYSEEAREAPPWRTP